MLTRNLFPRQLQLGLARGNFDAVGGQGRLLPREFLGLLAQRLGELV